MKNIILVSRRTDIPAFYLTHDTCLHGCIYCYANTDKEKSASFYKNHNPEWNTLDSDVEDYELINVGDFERV